MQRGYEYEKLLNKMYKIDIESNLASPLAGSGSLEINPADTVQKIVSDFFLSLEKDDIQCIAVLDKYYKKLEWDATVESQAIKDGSKLYLVYDEESFFRPVHAALIGFSIIIIASVLFITAAVLFAATGGDIPFDYGIVVDAGSTHTEVFLYQWFGSKFHGTGEVYQKNFCHIESGIANTYDPEELVLCVNKVVNALPENTPPLTLYLGATAGMRLLNITNPLDAHLILTTIKYALKTTSVKEGSVEIIEGEDEGLFSWITTNFLSETLKQDEIKNTYSALDLGGASTQLAFALDSDIVNISDTTALKLYGNNYNVVSKSFLCFGLSEASGRIEAILFMKNWRKIINDPCLPKDYSLEIKSKEFLKPCTRNDNLDKWLQKNSDISDLKVVGTSSYEECRSIIKELVNQSSCQNMGFDYCLSRILVAKPNRKFMAFSSFYYVVNYISPNGSLEDFIKATKSFCGLSFEQIKQRAHHKDELSHLLKYCFGAVYITELLMSNYGFSNSTWNNILFQQSIKGAEIGWSLGLMINASNAIPEEAPKPPVLNLSVFICLLIISVILGFLALILLQKKY